MTFLGVFCNLGVTLKTRKRCCTVDCIGSILGHKSPLDLELARLADPIIRAVKAARLAWDFPANLPTNSGRGDICFFEAHFLSSFFSTELTFGGNFSLGSHEDSTAALKARSGLAAARSEVGPWMDRLICFGESDFVLIVK